MDEEKKKIVMIVVAIACIVLAVVITFVTCEGGGSGRVSAGPINMLCVNPDCGASFELSREEYTNQLMANQSETTMPGMRGRGMAGPSVFTCPECGKESAYMATKCPECEAIFIQGQAGDQQFPDRCPECGYSDMENMSVE